MLLLHGRVLVLFALLEPKQQKILVHVGYSVENVKIQNVSIYISICKKV